MPEENSLIETILQDADKRGLRLEVIEDAKKYIDEGTVSDPVEAYVWAYEDWIK